MPAHARRIWPARVWHRLTWGLAFTPLVFILFASVDVTTAFAIALAFAPELFATAALLTLLFLLGRRVLRSSVLTKTNPSARARRR